MKFLITLLFLLKLAHSAPFLANYPISIHSKCPVISFTSGFISGSGLLPDLENCITNITNLTQNIDYIYQLYEAKTIESIGNAMVLFGNTVSNLIKDCGNTYIDYFSIKGLEHNLTNETFIIEGFERLYNNIGNILEELDNFKFYLDNGDYYQSGEFLGHVFKVFLTEKSERVVKLGLGYPFINCDIGDRKAMISIEKVFYRAIEGKGVNLEVKGRILKGVTLKNAKLQFLKNGNIIEEEVLAVDNKALNIVGGDFQVAFQGIKSSLKVCL